MKILFVSSGNKSNGEPSILVKNQGEALEKLGHTIIYYVIIGKGFSGYLKAVFPLLRLLRKETEINVIHAHYSLSAFSASLVKLLLFRKLKLVVSLMGSDAQLKGWKRTFTRFLSQNSWSTTIVKSKQMAIDLQLTNYLVMPNGVQLEKFKETDSFEKTILFAADPSRESKNYPLAKAAFDLFSKTHPDYHLKVVYNVSHEEIIQETKKAACVLLSSKWEGSPNIIKEAMACNRPIVATNVGDVAWLLEGVEGCYVCEQNEMELSKNLSEAIQFYESKKVTNGRSKLISLELDAESVAKKLSSCYE